MQFWQLKEHFSKFVEGFRLTFTIFWSWHMGVRLYCTEDLNFRMNLSFLTVVVLTHVYVCLRMRSPLWLCATFTLCCHWGFTFCGEIDEENVDWGYCHLLLLFCCNGCFVLELSVVCQQKHFMIAAVPWEDIIITMDKNLSGNEGEKGSLFFFSFSLPFLSFTKDSNGALSTV